VGHNSPVPRDLLGQGSTARTEQFRELIVALGGTLEGYYFSANGQIVSVMNFSEPQNFALSTLQGMASGTWLEHADIEQIWDGAEMDAELASQSAAYQPPGS
jgi:hypothetical protein